MELIRKALPGLQLTLTPFSTKRETHQQLTDNEELCTKTLHQEAVPLDTMVNDNIRQQAEELLKRISQQRETDEPLQKLCNALYTCDPHRTGKYLCNKHQ